MNKVYDAIVVGARCAGAPTAMLLARAGYEVLLVDRAEFPSDTLSTHLIHPTGVAALRRWGLLDRVTATGCPPVDTYSFDFGPFTIDGTPRPWEGESTDRLRAAAHGARQDPRRRRGGVGRRGPGGLQRG
jgi:2-polyprenyl-6-methoxyphenol hydroxylase-like FAD-dependent oxidoreductase